MLASAFQLDFNVFVLWALGVNATFVICLVTKICFLDSLKGGTASFASIEPFVSSRKIIRFPENCENSHLEKKGYK